MQSTWSSLEVVKLVVQSATPIMVTVVGFWINRRLKEIEDVQWTNHKVTEKRLALFEEMAPLINDLLCYFRYIGCWKELKPSEVIEHKRALDRTAYVNQALFSEEFHTKYSNFMEACFLTYSGWGEDPKLLTLTDRRKGEALEAALGEKWDTSWDDKYFAKEGKVYEYRDEEGNVYKKKKVVVDPTEAEVRNAPHELIVIDSKGEKARKAHDELMSWFSDELGVGFHMSDVTRSGRTTTNVR